MLVAISGYNASGKTTMVRALSSSLDANDVAYKTLKFDSLYPLSHLTRRKRRKILLKKDGSLNLRSLEGQKGTWNQPFRLPHFCNIVGAALILFLIRIVNRRRVILFDRYFVDRLVNFASTGMLYRIAKRLLPSADIVFVLLPEASCWEQRILERVRERSGLDISELPAEDRAVLQQVCARYEHWADGEPFARILDSASETAFESAWRSVSALLDLENESPFVKKKEL